MEHGERFEKRHLPAALAGMEDIRGAWDAVYEKGFFVAHVLGQREYGRSVSTGSKGTKLQVEIFSPGTVGGETRAVARDSNGNIYKVSLYGTGFEASLRVWPVSGPCLARVCDGS